MSIKQIKHSQDIQEQYIQEQNNLEQNILEQKTFELEINYEEHKYLDTQIKNFYLERGEYNYYYNIKIKINGYKLTFSLKDLETYNPKHLKKCLKSLKKGDNSRIVKFDDETDENLGFGIDKGKVFFINNKICDEIIVFKFPKHQSILLLEEMIEQYDKMVEYFKF